MSELCCDADQVKLRTGDVKLFNNGVCHNQVTARPARGIHPAHVNQVNRLLETGYKPAAIAAKIALESAKTPGAPPPPHYDQLRAASCVSLATIISVKP